MRKECNITSTSRRAGMLMSCNHVEVELTELSVTLSARLLLCCSVVCGFLWPPCVADADIIFLSCGFFHLLSFFFLRLISAIADWMSTILPHMVWP